MSKKRLKFVSNIAIVLTALILIISTINNLSVAASVTQAKNLWDLYNCTLDKEGWYGFNPTDAVGNSILDSNIDYTSVNGAYCIDNHTGHISNANYRIVNIIDINNNTSANTVKVYSEEHPEGVEYSVSNKNVKPYIMIAYLAKNNYNADLTRIILNNTYNAQMKNAGLSKYVNAAGYGADLNYFRNINAAYQYANNMANQGSLETASLSSTMTASEKENVTVITDGGKTYIGPYKVNLSGGCKVGEITVTTATNQKESTEKASGISTDLKTVKSVENVVDSKEFYVVIDKEIDEIKSVKVTAKQAITSLKARLLITSAGRAQNMIFYNSEETKQGQSVELEVPKYGKLQITKTDEFKNSNLNLKNIGFVIWSQSKKAYIQEKNGKIEYVDFATAKKNEFKTDENGKTKEIQNLPLGKYTIYETSIPGNLKIYYDLPETTLNDKDGKTVKTNAKLVKVENKNYVQIKSGQIATITAQNKRDFTTIVLRKIDEDTKQPLNGIEFKLYSTIKGKEGWVITKNNEYAGVTKNFAEASSFVTLENGYTTNTNKVPVGSYAVYETGLGKYEGIYKDLEPIRINGANVGYKGLLKGTIDVKANESSAFTVTETNKQAYIKISGNVWEDVLQGKNDQYYNNLLGEEDNRINGIEVRLMDKTTNQVVKTTKTAYDETTKTNGVYRFEKVEIEKLANYYIEFIYDGITYTTVTTPKESNIKITDENTTKAAENQDSRKTLNNAFTELTGEGQKLTYNNKDITLSYSKVKDGDATVVLSNNISDRNKGLDTANKVINLTTSGDFTLSGTTAENYLLSKYKELVSSTNKQVTEIKNINLGLKMREMSSIRLVKDIDNAKVSVNGKTYQYTYNTLISENVTATTFGVSFENKYNLKYNTPVYRADAVFESADKSKELQVYITYKIALANNSKSIYTTVNSIREIYSKELEFTKLYTLDDANKERVISSNIEAQVNGNYKTYTFNKLNIQVEPQTAKYIYLTFQLPKEQIYNIAGKELNTGKDFMNYAEVASYTLYSDTFNSLYAGFDERSIPNNLEVEKYEETVENDSNRAPALQIVDAGQRTLSGIVFEDADKDENDQERIGDGKYTDGENQVANVKVRLLDENGNEVKVYDADKKEFVEQSSTSNNSGVYTISGFIPGDYTVQFTWGEGANSVTSAGRAVTVDSYKSTIWTQENISEKENDKWYLQTQIRYSDAQDDYSIREKLDGNSASLLEMLKTPVTDVNKVENKATMKSNTKAIEVGIEAKDYDQVLEGDTPLYKFEISNIDLGLIERPRQTMDISKNVDSFRVTTDQGQIMADARINEQGKWEVLTGTVTGGPEYGYVRAEMDSDIINSGTKATVGYKIKLTNNSDKDYATKDYYLYGIKDNSEQVALKVTGIYDYLKGLNASVDDNRSWEVLDKTSAEAKQDTITQVVAENMTANSAMNSWFEYNSETGETLLVEEISGEKTTERVIEFAVEKQQSETKEFKNLIRENSVIAKFTENGSSEIELKPGESKELTYYGETALSSGKDIIFDNDVEIVDVQKTYKTGRSITLEHSNFYDRAEWITITPPTGEDKDYTAIIIISAAAVAVLGIGIVVIKKVVLK